MNYQKFIDSKRQLDTEDGFDPVWMPDFLYDFQRSLVEWAIRKGRAAIFADCGLGKTPMQLVWAQNVVEKTNKPVLILTPLAVASQTVQEASKFGIEAEKSRNGTFSGKIVATNYQQLQHYNQHDFGGIVCDESSILKNFKGATKQAITEFAREMPYRLLCTATAAPNDYHELGTSSEALGYLGYRDMLTKFFKEETKKDYLGWGRKTYRFRGHAAEPFWKWVCSWARACRTPSDIGYPDKEFVLPELFETEYVLETSTPREGLLFSVPARDLSEQREERRATLKERCEVAAELASDHRLSEPDHESSVIWCHLNDEGRTLSKMLPDAVEVHGSLADEEKEDRFLAFQRGEVPILITKPKIGAWGLNWQHCNNVITFPSHSWEQYYQEVRRCYRFQQEKPVTVTTVSTEGESGVLKNLQRKSRQADEMFSKLVRHMHEGLSMDADNYGTTQEEIPEWLSQTK